MSSQFRRMLELCAKDDEFTTHERAVLLAIAEHRYSPAVSAPNSEPENGIGTAEACRRLAISRSTFYEQGLNRTLPRIRGVTHKHPRYSLNGVIAVIQSSRALSPKLIHAEGQTHVA